MSDTSTKQVDLRNGIFASAKRLGNPSAAEKSESSHVSPLTETILLIFERYTHHDPPLYVPVRSPDTNAMLTESFIRKSIWASVPINLIGAMSFAMPDSVFGRLAGLPNAPAIYTAMMGFMILLFGGTYAWIAFQPKINRPMLTLGAISKLGVFTIAALLSLNSSVPTQTVLLISVDLLLATLWLAWLWSSRASIKTD